MEPEVTGNNSTFNRREMLFAAGTAIGAIGAGLLYSSLSRPRDGLSLAELQAFALKSHDENPISTFKVPESADAKSTSLTDYEFGMGRDVRQLFSSLVEATNKSRHPHTLIVADVGGSYGTAISELAKVTGVEPFVIDVIDHAVPGSPLPSNRHIVKEIENTGLPDNTFDVLISYNSSEYFKMHQALPEMYRIIKPGGMVLFDLVENANTDGIASLREFPHPQHVYVAAIVGRKMCTFTLPDFLKWVDKTAADEKGAQALDLVRYTVTVLKLDPETKLKAPPTEWREYPPRAVLMRMLKDGE